MTPPTIAVKLSALFAIAALGSSLASGQGATAPPVAKPAVKQGAAPRVKPFEVAGTFTYFHTNGPPGGCGCISMYGASGSGAYYLARNFAFVADLSFVHQGNVNGTGKSLNFASYLFGGRIPVPVPHTRIVPFGQIMVGFTHDSGPIALVSASNYQDSNVPSMSAGGGVDVRLTPHLTLRAGEVEYVLTRFLNGVNSRQNNFRINSGVAVRF
jgi:peptidoglycan-associated lipoprotein